MTLISRYTVNCPVCKKKIEFNRYDSITTNLDSDLKQQLINNEFGKLTCQNCGEIFHVAYGFLYHDPLKNYMISFMDDYTDLNNEISNFPAHYRLRQVKEMPQFIEKLRIFDLNLDDIIIELVKIILHSMRDDDDQYLFIDYRKNHLYFETSKCGVIKINALLYDIAEEYYNGIKQYIDDIGFVKVDMSYAKNIWSLGGGET